MSETPKSFLPGQVLLVTIHTKPAFCARVEDIRPDRKKGWWQIRLLVLSLPLRTLTWILDDDQIRGAEFTMQGHPVRLERVVAPDQPQPEAQPDEPESSQGGRVISLFDDD